MIKLFSLISQILFLSGYLFFEKQETLLLV